MNRRLIEDEGSRNPLGLVDRRARMAGRPAGEWTVLLATERDEPVGHVVFRPRADESAPERREVVLRQCFVEREQRGRGVGRAMVDRVDEGWLPPGAAIACEVLASNPGGERFWRSLGFQTYAVTLRREPSDG